ncbi:WD repeat-containing protein 26 [Homalodisca vitripennis]|nr:WD repeat-containing protein 26 [Homalodisca vitripennis]
MDAQTFHGSRSNYFLNPFLPPSHYFGEGGFHMKPIRTSLASSGESDDGGLAPPPRKKSRPSLEATMQQPANGCTQHNGATEDDHIPSSSAQQNGTDIAPHSTTVNGEISPKRLDRTDYEIVRLIGQHLKTIGLK